MHKIVDVSSAKDTKKLELMKKMDHLKAEYPSEFNEYLNNPILDQVERELSRPCVKKPSLYDQCKKYKERGLKICVLPRGSEIYKSMLGYVTPAMEQQFLKDNSSKLSWFGNIYVSYLFGQQTWGGLNPYRAVEDVRLFDYFDVDNLNLFFTFLKQHGHHDLERRLRFYSGYQISEHEQFDRMLRLYGSDWEELWRFSKPVLTPFTARYCRQDRVVGVNPVSKLRGIYYTDKTLLEKPLNEFLTHYKLHGVIRRQIVSTIELYGLTVEEVIIPNHTVLKMLKLDTTSSTYWMNWKVPEMKLVKHGFNINPGITGGKNRFFRMVKFYFANAMERVPHFPKSRGMSILTYNVYEWSNINGDIMREENMMRILSFITNVGADVICLQEMNNDEQFLSGMRSAGYVHFVLAENGHPLVGRPDMRKSYAAVFSRLPFDENEIVDLSVYKFVRNVPVVKIGGVTIAAVHLEIGYSYHNLKGKEYIHYQRETALLRQQQLKTLIKKYRPDIIAGDFNFGTEDPEARILKAYNRPAETATNPFGTMTDTVYTRFQIVYSHVVKCNYTDHLPHLFMIDIQAKQESKKKRK
jgi:endonuclease/exonuclease/phosphatase family metal-dependent hydrolase